MGDNEGGNQGDNGNKTKKILMIIFVILAIVILSIIILSIWKSSTSSNSGKEESGDKSKSEGGEKEKSKGEEKLVDHRYSSDETSSRRLKASDLRGQDADFRSNLTSSGAGRASA